MTDPEEVMVLVARIRPLLAGRASHVQGGALADLLAIFLAGHIVPGNPAATDDLRERILQMHLEMVRELVPVNASEIHGKRAD